MAQNWKPVPINILLSGKSLDNVRADKALENDYQDSRDMIIRSVVKDLRHYEEQLKEIDEEIERMYNSMGCTLTTIPGVNVITAAKIVSEIGDVRRFSSASKLAQFAAIAPLKMSLPIVKQPRKGKKVIVGYRQRFISLLFR